MDREAWKTTPHGIAESDRTQRLTFTHLAPILVSLRKFAVLSMPANLENSAVATGLEKLSFHSNPKEGQCQRMFKLPYN